MKRLIQSLALVATILFAQGCATLPTAVTVATWVANIVPQVLDVVDLVERVLNDAAPDVQVEVKTAIKRVEDAIRKVEESKGKGVARAGLEALQALEQAYAGLLAVLEKNGLAQALGSDDTLMGVAPGRLAVPTFALIKERAGAE